MAEGYQNHNEQFKISVDTDYFTIVKQSCYMIDGTIKYITARIRVDAVPTATDVMLCFWDSKYAFTQDVSGIVFPLFKSSSQWATTNSIIYGFLSSINVLGHKADLSAGSYITIQIIGV